MRTELVHVLNCANDPLNPTKIINIETVCFYPTIIVNHLWKRYRICSPVPSGFSGFPVLPLFSKFPPFNLTKWFDSFLY